jgi:cytochrome c556
VSGISERKNKIMRTIFMILLCALLLVPVVAPQILSGAQAPFKIVATVKQVMTAFTIPASETIFNAAADVPKNDSDWEAVQNAALVLAESGNLLMLPGRVRDNDQWIKDSRAMIEGAVMAVEAAKQKKTDALENASNEIYGTCEACHSRYLGTGE